MSDTVQQIKDKLSIEEVITPYVELHKAGRHFKGKSPFTSENTPSFYVSPDRGMYYCFSSNQGGDMFTFVQTMEGVDFKGALKILADKAGVELVREDPKKRDERDTQYAILESATKFYSDSLHTLESAKQYVLDRGVTEQTLQLWRIGLAPDEWRAGREYLQAQKYTDEQLRKAGLVKGDPGKDPYDVFRNRIMFPMSDPSGRVVAFSGRTLSSDKETPKYVNSPETELYKKSEILYGYDKAKQGIRKFDFSLIVEGQFDVVLAHQAGYNNTVAVSGTALTNHHVQLLQRLSNRVVLALDADRAGLSAVKRAADVMLARGMDVKVARMPEGKDPADIIKDDPQQFKDIIGHSVTVIEHLLNVLQASTRDARAFLLEVREDVLPRIVKIPSDLEQEHFAGAVAEALGSTKDGVLAELQREREKLADHASTEVVETIAPPEPEVSVSGKSKRFDEVRSYAAVLASVLEGEEQKLFSTYFSEFTGADPAVVRSETDPQLAAKLTFTVEQQFTDLLPKLRQQEITHTLNELRRLVLHDALQTARAAVNQAEANNSSDELEVALKKVQQLQQKMAVPKLSYEVFQNETSPDEA